MTIKDYIQTLFDIKNRIKDILVDKFSDDDEIEVTDNFTTYPDLIDKLGTVPEPSESFQIRFTKTNNEVTLTPTTSTVTVPFINAEDLGNLDISINQPIYSAVKAFTSRYVDAIRLGSNSGSGQISFKLNPSKSITPKKVVVECWPYATADQTNIHICMFDIALPIPTVNTPSSTTEPTYIEPIVFEPTLSGPVSTIDIKTSNADGKSTTTSGFRAIIKSITIYY